LILIYQLYEICTGYLLYFCFNLTLNCRDFRPIFSLHEESLNINYKTSIFRLFLTCIQVSGIFHNKFFNGILIFVVEASSADCIFLTGSPCRLSVLVTWLPIQSCSRNIGRKHKIFVEAEIYCLFYCNAYISAIFVLYT
jgi:hypothetical protein